MNLLTDLGTRMKMIRLYGGVKQKVLAEKLGIQSSLLSMYEQGKREPSIPFLAAFCEHFNMSLSQLFIFHKLENSKELPSKHKEIITDLSLLFDELEKLKLTNIDGTRN